MEKRGPYKNYRPKNYRNQLWNTREDGTLDVSNLTEDPSLTQQQFKDECDINNIIKSYQETGTINHKNPKTAVFGDFSEVKDFQESLNIVNEANEVFNQLPAKIRSRFNNNPAELVEFCNHAENLEEAISLGLANKPETDQNANQNLKQNANMSNSVPKPKSKKSAVIPPESPSDEVTE